VRKPLIVMGALSAVVLAGPVALPMGAAAALPKVADTAIPSVGPFPAVSGYARTLRGDITLGWHGPPPAGGVTNGSMLQSAAHNPPRRPGARARHRSGWG